MDKLLCIYHANCPDGFTAAWVVRKRLGAENVEFFAASHGSEPPDVTGRNVDIVDFSYKRPVLESMIEKSVSVKILDHHKTAKADLEGIASDKCHCTFDMGRSGARIAWDHYFPGQEPPMLLLNIEDHDLWKFRYDTTRNATAGLNSYPMTFETWDDLMSASTAYSLLLIAGEHINRKAQQDLDHILPMVTRRMTIAGHNVPVANVPHLMASAAGNILCQGEPFAASYYDADGKRVFSLRSRDEAVDVSAIAAKFGGGGHRNAAGFQAAPGWEGDAA